ncbi:MAG TPA: GNAT family protein [Acidimicrobiales bacterium]|nr:GNAT family protein [Acidimicrobiales bacterium]
MGNVLETVELSADGGRLILRPPRRAEAAAALAMLTDPDVVLWNPAPLVVDVVSARDWCDRGSDWAAGGHATFSIVVTATGEYAGNVSLFDVDLTQGVGSIGYRVAPGHRRRGIATAALAATTAWALGDLRLFRVQVFHAVENEASCAVATRCGFALEGVLRSGSVFGDGLRHDEHLHARLACDP